MCCTTEGFSHHHNHDCICEVEHHPHFFRRFLSKEERIARLTEYKDDLSREIKEIENRIAALKSV